MKTQKTPIAAAVSNFAGFDDWFEVFTSGEHTDSNGNTKTFTHADLDSIVANHSADTSAPLVIGHPKTNHPAYGWSSDLKREGDTLFAKAKDVVTEFEQGVKRKMWPKRSVSIVPDGNDGYKLRHIGFLGAKPPAVEGMADLAFSENDQAITFEFSMHDAVRQSAWSLSSIGRVLRGIKNMLISEKDLATADELIPEYQIESISEHANAMQRELDNEQETSTRFNADAAASDISIEPKPQSDGEQAMSFSQDDVDNAVKAEKERADAAEAKLKQQNFEQQKNNAQTLIDGLVADGKLLPAQTEGLAEFMAELGETEVTFNFNAADGEKTQTPYDFAVGLLTSLKPQIKTGDSGYEEDDDDTNEFSAPNGYTVNKERVELDRKANEYAAKHGVDYLTAVSVLEKE